jgi:hypothetical protein
MPHDRYVEVCEKMVRPSAAPVLQVQQQIAYYDGNGVKATFTAEEIGEKLMFEYSPGLVFLHEKDLRDCVYQCIERNDQCKMWLSSMRSALLSYTVCSDVSLRFIGNINGVNVGHGVCAEADIPEGTYIGEYVGLVSTVTETITRENHYNFQYPSCEGGLEINGREVGNITRFINHSTTPNAAFHAISLDDIMHVICVRSSVRLLAFTSLTSWLSYSM